MRLGPDKTPVNNQLALEYATLMMLTDSFKHCKCHNPLLEERMRIQYCEVRDETRALFESGSDGFLSERLLPRIPNSIQNRPLDVILHKAPDGSHEFWCSAPGLRFILMPCYSGGRKISFKCHLRLKGTGETVTLH